jgi:hypothetical protein
MKAVNLRKEKYTHYIGRGSILGNPFKIGKDGSREEVIKKYEEHIYDIMYDLDGELTVIGRAIYRLPSNAILGCYCKPKACHGDIIVKIWKELHEK